MPVQVFGDVAIDPSRVQCVSKVPRDECCDERASSLLIGVKDSDGFESLVLAQISISAADALLKHFSADTPEAASCHDSVLLDSATLADQSSGPSAVAVVA